MPPDKAADIIWLAHGLRGWDIFDLAFEKDKFGGSGDLADTVTVDDHVYRTEQVNYWLWGIIARMDEITRARLQERDIQLRGWVVNASNAPRDGRHYMVMGDGTRRSEDPYESPSVIDDYVDTVMEYRFVFWFWQIPFAAGNIGARMDWTRAGYTGDFSDAVGTAIPGAKPNPTKWGKGLWAYVGDVSQNSSNVESYGVP
jgi:hypothetical protein